MKDKAVKIRYIGGCSCEYPAPEGPVHVEPGQIITVSGETADRLILAGGWEPAKPAEKGE
jgi:hypothetical protein